MVDLTSGSIGQIQGPFEANYSIEFTEGQRGHLVKLGIIICDKDLMTFEEIGFYVNIKTSDGLITNVKFGREGIYELDDVLSLGEVSFPQGAPAGVLVDYVIMDE